jgi:SH3-like domain-containing protein
MKDKYLIACVAALMSMTANAGALEFKSVGVAAAVMYDAPSAKGRKVYVAPRGMPVEVILTYGEWDKVRDAAGDLAWIESKLLKSNRTLIVKAANAHIRASAEETAPIVFTADKGVLLEMAEAGASGWIKVRHRDGQGGYVRASEVWGE